MPNETLRRALRNALPTSAMRLGGVLALSALTSACAVTPPTPPAAPRAPQASATPATPVARNAPTPAMPAAATAAPSAPSVAAAPATPMATIDNVGEHEATSSLLRYADRVRVLAHAELAQEIAALGEPGPQAVRQMQLAIALMHSNQPVETARALGLVQRVATSTAADAAPYRSLARLLANRLLEQRKLEEAAERQAQQLREQQRRIDQLNERLEAMRAIERSLNNRAPARPPAP